MNRPWVSVRAIVAYAFLALAFSWPLALHLSTHLTGTPDGDTGVFVWNQWVFQHALLQEHGSPLFTREIFSLARPANLAFHNYTIFQDLLALPLLQVFDVVTTFNVVYLSVIVITGYAAFRLAWHVTGRPFESWLAGALFSWSPALVTRGGGHFSLVAAAPIAVFVLLMLRWREQSRWRDALALGATICWAATADAYYAIYCLLIAFVFLAVTTVSVADNAKPERDRVLRAIDLLLVCLGGLVVALLVGSGWQVTVFGLTVSVHGLYTPVLLLTLTTLGRLAWTHRHVTMSVDRRRALGFLRLMTTAGVVSAAMLSPVLYAVGVRLRDVGLESSSIFWRSSPPGVDVLSYFLPNPNHPLAPAALRAWLSPRPDAYFENVASLTFSAVIAIAAAVRTGWRPSRFWAAMAATFGLLALGPFVHIAGVDTYVPGPWALLRYVPIVRLARSPSRFSIVFMLAVSVLFAGALCWLGDRVPRRRQLLLIAATVILGFELLAVPRPLYSAEVPSFYKLIAADARPTRVLELPFGVRDGTLSVGDFTARSQYFQTTHGKPLIGGYLSRVSQRRVAEFRNEPMLDALATLSEGGTLDEAEERVLVEMGPHFVRRASLGYVVIDDARTPPRLQAFAVRALRLKRVAGERALTLYVPNEPK